MSDALIRNRDAITAPRCRFVLHVAMTRCYAERRMIPGCMTKILAALTMLCVASIASAKDNFIDGQVFIVTGAHKSVKLGLVTVAAYRPDEFASAAASTQSQIES